MQVSRLTGGQVYKYTYFQADLDGERFIADLRHNISRWLSYRIRIPPVASVADPDPGSEFFPSLIPDPHQSIFTQKNDV
jgi:protein transport protein SEC24